MVKVYTGALIDKPLRSINNNLQEKIASDLKKYLDIRKEAVASQELNTFLLASGQKNGTGEFDPLLIDKIEKLYAIKFDLMDMISMQNIGDICDKILSKQSS